MDSLHSRLSNTDLNTDLTVRVLLAGKAAPLAAAVREAQQTPGFVVVGVLSEDPWSEVAEDPPWLGGVGRVEEALVSRQADLILLAGADLESTAIAVQAAERFGIEVRILPSLLEVAQGQVRVSRALGLSALESHGKSIELSEEPHPELVEAYRRRTVLVTGAGGSIGSELVRQLAGLPVKRIVLMDRDENALVETSSLLSDAGMETVPLVGDVRDEELVRHTFRHYAPEIVLHAAAYKHVPILESNCCEAVLNNVTGTRVLAHAALEAGAERFVLISTDKAVMPSSVMGATKRVAELVVEQHGVLAKELSRRTRFASVRFVNVLGSRGSVAPIFLRQIAEGGPVTITHEEMTRYFMTVSQAAQLVLQASTLAEAGNVFMLEMGDPVKIVDFANDLIRMSGLRPGRDIEVKVTGIRPGERLQEEPLGGGGEQRATKFPFVFEVSSVKLREGFGEQAGSLEAAAKARQTGRVLGLLAELPIAYTLVTSFLRDTTAR